MFNLEIAQILSNAFGALLLRLDSLKMYIIQSEAKIAPFSTYKTSCVAERFRRCNFQVHADAYSEEKIFSGI